MAAMLTMAMVLPAMASSLPVKQVEVSETEEQPDLQIIVHKRNGQVVGVTTIDDGVDCIYVLVLNNGAYESELDGCKD